MRKWGRRGNGLQVRCNGDLGRERRNVEEVEKVEPKQRMWVGGPNEESVGWGANEESVGREDGRRRGEDRICGRVWLECECLCRTDLQSVANRERIVNRVRRGNGLGGYSR